MNLTSAAISLKPGPISLEATRKTPLPNLPAVPKPDWSGSPRPSAAVIVLGRDDAGKPHASAFGEAERIQAKRAARKMGMALITVDPANADLITLAVGLPIGKVFASGKAFVPFVKGSTFDQLEPFITQTADDLASDPEAAEPEGGEAGDDGDAGETGGSGDAGAGVDRGSKSGDKRKGGSSLTKRAAAAAADASASASPVSDASSYPTDWSGIAKGSIVLAMESADTGAWYVATVLEEQSSGRFNLRWRDFDGYPSFVRKREELGLLNPQSATA